MPSSNKFYRYHVENLREISIAIQNTAVLARRSIAGNDAHGHLRTQIRLYAFLLGAWAECRLKKLLTEDNGFTDAERTKIFSKQKQFEQWNETVTLAFKKHFKVALTRKSLGVKNFARMTAILEALDEDLKIIIEIRNRLAHGQWIYPFTEDGKKVENDKYKLINKENLQSLQFKYQILTHLADIIHDLVVSPPTFERDFESRFQTLEQARINLKRKDYNDYAAGLQKSRSKARKS